MPGSGFVLNACQFVWKPHQEYTVVAATGWVLRRGWKYRPRCSPPTHSGNRFVADVLLCSWCCLCCPACLFVCLVVSRQRSEAAYVLVCIARSGIHWSEATDTNLPHLGLTVRRTNVRNGQRKEEERLTSCYHADDDRCGGNYIRVSDDVANKAGTEDFNHSHFYYTPLYTEFKIGDDL